MESESFLWLFCVKEFNLPSKNLKWHLWELYKETHGYLVHPQNGCVFGVHSVQVCSYACQPKTQRWLLLFFVVVLFQFGSTTKHVFLCVIVSTCCTLYIYFPRHYFFSRTHTQKIGIGSLVQGMVLGSAEDLHWSDKSGHTASVRRSCLCALDDPLGPKMNFRCCNPFCFLSWLEFMWVTCGSLLKEI